MPKVNKGQGWQYGSADVSQEERARLAGILHDQIAQVMSAVGLQLELLKMDFGPRVPEIASRTGEIQHMLERALVHVRTLVSELNPAPSKGGGTPRQKAGRPRAE